MGAPSVTMQERDMSTRVPSFPGVYGAMVVAARKGPIDKAVLISNEADFLRVFTPNEKIEVGYSSSHFSAKAFLSKSDKLWVKRAIPADMLYGGAVISSVGNGGAALGTGEADPEGYTFLADEAVLIAGSNPGLWNDSISISIWNAKTVESIDTATGVTEGGTGVDDTVTVTQIWATGWPVKFALTTEEGGDALPAGIVADTTYYAIYTTDTTIALASSLVNALAGTAIELTVAVSGTMSMTGQGPEVKEPGAHLIYVYWNDGTSTTLKEEFFVSRTDGTKDGFGNNIYIETALESSNYILAVDDTTETSEMDCIPYPLSLVGGVDGTAISSANISTALDFFANEADIPCTVIMDGGENNVIVHNKIITICEARMDCVGLGGVPYTTQTAETYLTDMIEYRNSTLNADTSFFALYASHVKIYDQDNDRSLYISPDGYAGAAVSYTASNYEMWFPVGGDDRGSINVTDVRRRLSGSDMDTLYDAGINPIRFYPGKGINIWGQKTLLSRPSSLDRLNVRLLLIAIEPAIQDALEAFLFTLNNASTRSIVTNMINNYMDGIKAREGVTDFYTVCDETNNLPTDIDNYRLNVSLYIKPITAVEYIPFKMVITSSGVDFTALS